MSQAVFVLSICHRDEVREMMNKKKQGSSTLARFEEEMNEVNTFAFLIIQVIG